MTAISALLSESGLPLTGITFGNVRILIARQGERVVGTAALEIFDSSCVMRSFAIETSCRGSGLARRLITALLNLARDTGCTEAYLLTHNVQRLAGRYAFRTVTRDEVSPAALASPEFGLSRCSTATVMRCVLSPNLNSC